MRNSTRWGVALVALVPLIAGSARTLAGTVVWTGPGGNGHSYQLLLDGDASWSDAEHAAPSGGYLATIESAGEQALLEKFLSTSAAPSGSYWFGLHESSTEGDYRLVTGGTPTYTHWNPGQPDNFAGRENSASILWSNAGDATFDRRGFWNDLPSAGGYPQVASVYPDLVSAGFLIEYNTRLSGASELEVGNVGSGGGPATSVPLPAALVMFPIGVAVAVIAARRFRRSRN